MRPSPVACSTVLTSYVSRGQKADAATDDVAEKRVQDAAREPEERPRRRFQRDATERRDDRRRSLGRDVSEGSPGARLLYEYPQPLTATERANEYRQPY